MATINFQLHGSGKAPGGKAGVSTITGINTSGISGWNFDRVIVISASLSATLKVPAGAYEHVGADASGNWTYAPADRNR